VLPRKTSASSSSCFVFVVNKRLLPTLVEVREQEGGRVVLAMRRGFTLLRSYVTVTDGVARNRALQEQAVLDRRRVPRPGWNGAARGRDQGRLEGVELPKPHADGSEIGRVTKKWAGLGKELFTSPHNT
jgi:hypothetical protein